MEAADITLIRGDLNGIADAIGMSRLTMRNIKQNLGWALGYNSIGIPIAASGFLPWQALPWRSAQYRSCLMLCVYRR